MKRARRPEALFDPGEIGEEEDEQNVAGLVLDQHFVWRTRARRRRAMFDHLRLDQHDLSRGAMAILARLRRSIVFTGK